MIGRLVSFWDCYLLSLGVMLNFRGMLGGFASLPIQKRQKIGTHPTSVPTIACFYDDSLLFFFFRAAHLNNMYPKHIQGSLELDTSSGDVENVTWT